MWATTGATVVVVFTLGNATSLTPPAAEPRLAPAMCCPGLTLPPSLLGLAAKSPRQLFRDPRRPGFTQAKAFYCALSDPDISHGAEQKRISVTENQEQALAGD
eukprot:2339840-Rhodomonas_salina.5